MKYKLENITISNLGDLEKKVLIGARFVVFNYRIGLGLISLLRISPAIFINRKEDLAAYQKKYNTLNLLFGPWFLFKGPWLTYKAYKLNTQGGIDVTNDIMLNITEASLKSKEIYIEKIHNLFVKLTPSDKKNIKNALEKLDKNIVSIEKAYAGIFINVEQYEEPYFVIGMKLNRNSTLNIEHIKNSLNNYYYKFVRFEFFELNSELELSQKLVEQGELIYGI